jgi:selenocysteine lyase/cysteine desulfurase
VRAGDIHAAMNTHTGVISMSYVQFSNGFRTDIEELASLKGNHALVINGSQAAGVFEIDVKRMKIDALCATGHKWMRSGYGSGFVYISKELQAAVRQRTIGWLSVHDPYEMRNDEVHLRHDMSARAELGCPHFAGVFALGASIELMQSIGIANIEARALELNRVLTRRLNEIGGKSLSPLDDEKFRSAETLVAAEDPAKIVAALAAQKILVTEKPQGFRVSTDFFNDEEDIERLVTALKSI